MKIKHIDGTEIDSDKMPDVSAELAERIDEFGKFCEKYKIPYFLTSYDAVLGDFAGAHNVNSDTKNWSVLCRGMNGFFTHYLKGQVRVVQWDKVKHLYPEDQQ